MKLYELTEQYASLLELAEDGDIPEDVFEDTLEALSGEIDDKIDGVCGVIKNLSADADALIAEATKLGERAKAKAKRCERLEGYLSDMLQKLGRTNFENSRHVVKFNKGERLVFTDEAAVIEYLSEHYPDLVKVKTEAKPDKTGIKKMIKDGTEIPFAVTEVTMSISVK